MRMVYEREERRTLQMVDWISCNAAMDCIISQGLWAIVDCDIRLLDHCNCQRNRMVFTGKFAICNGIGSGSFMDDEQFFSELKDYFMELANNSCNLFSNVLY